MMENSVQLLDDDVLGAVSGGSSVPTGAGWIPVGGAIGSAAGASSATSFTIAAGGAGGAGIVAAGVAGWGLGTWIYNKFDTQIQDTIAYVMN